jgi:alkanesulfonate monooxygenase SsuD/methylene tetrahydromethanopterin reductase-like flavin-dependent oxidoreductase (luciferase family)
MKKNKFAALAIAGALSLGTISGVTVAQADTGHAVGGPEAAVASVLSSLVTKGTITQAQSDAITAALNAAKVAAKPAKPEKPEMDGMGAGGFAANTAARQAIVTSFLGKTAAELQTARKAGKSLATIATEAGKSPAVLIAAIVTYDNAQIDAAVTAGKLTAANATTLKAKVTDLVTKEVNNVGGPMGGMGRMGHGPDGDNDNGTSANGATGGTLVTPGTSTNGASSKLKPQKAAKKKANA